jgi:hypothetical protein
MKNKWFVTCALLFVSIPSRTQTMAENPKISLTKAQCTAVATCESGTVQCTGRRSSTSCSAVDFTCSGERGSVTCDGVTTLCPKAGEICHLEQRPAATLLLPYFEVDTAAGGRDTLVAVANAFDSPVLVKADLWTDLGVYVHGFNIYLASHDVQTFSLSEVLLNGVLPRTEPPVGTFQSCQNALPPTQIEQDRREDLQAALQGHPAKIFGPSGDRCGGLDYQDAILRGYMAFHTVSNCTTRTPSSGGYFSPGGTGDATDQNALWGDYIYVNFPVTAASTTNLVTAGLPMVHIRASCTDSATTTPGRYTFYGASTSWNAADNRQPLATNFQARVFNRPPAFNTDLIVWRDPKVVQGAFLCGGMPAWYPLAQESLVGFDEQGASYALGGRPFAAVTQRIHIGNDRGNLILPFDFGWLSLDLNGTVAAAGNNPSIDPSAQQAWVTVLQSSGTTGALIDAVWLDTACEALHKR